MRDVIPSEKVAFAIHGYDALPLTQVKYKNADSNVTYTHNQPTNRILSAPKWATPTLWTSREVLVIMNSVCGEINVGFG